MKSDDLVIMKDKIFNPGFLLLYNKSEEYKIPLIIYLHADKLEFHSGQYNEMGQQIIQFANENNILMLKELDYNLDASFYRDDIHLNGDGQRKMAEIVKPYLLEVLKQSENAIF
jgi:lysophospholipase L1-like esterase